jgi:hypothetical protein
MIANIARRSRPATPARCPQRFPSRRPSGQRRPASASQNAVQAQRPARSARLFAHEDYFWMAQDVGGHDLTRFRTEPRYGIEPSTSPRWGSTVFVRERHKSRPPRQIGNIARLTRKPQNIR